MLTFIPISGVCMLPILLLTVWRMPYVRMPVIRWKGYVRFWKSRQRVPKETEHVFALDDKERSGSGFGIWERFDCRDLIVPLDTHVCRVAYTLGLTETETFSLKNARRITEALAEAFPDDPCLGDFALFGSGVSGVL